MEVKQLLPWAALVLVVLVMVAYIAGKRRQEACRRFARQRGLSFSARELSEIQRKSEGFPLFHQGRKKSISNVVHGQYEGVYIWLFDYKFGEEYEHARHSFRQTVMLLQAENSNFGSFHLFPKNIFHKITNVLSKKDIDFPSHKNFGRRYSVRGGDETAVRKMFDEAVIQYFASHGGMTVEGKGDSLLIYRLSRLIRPDNLHEFMSECMDISRLLAG